MNLTVKEAYIEYLKLVKLKQKPQSYRSIKSRFENHILPYFENKKLGELTTNNYIDWQLKIEEKCNRYEYKKALHYAFVTFLNYCMLFHGLDKNVGKMVGNFNDNYELKKKIEFWTCEEFNKFINIINEDIYKELFDFMFFTGCRLGEILALTFNDFKEELEKININKTISKESFKGKRIITTPKTRSSIRTIDIDAYLCNKIKKLKTYYQNKYSDFNNDFYIFGGIKALAPTTIERKKNKYCKLAKVKQIRLHDFRHSHASILLDKKIPILAIAQRLGHSDIATTLNTYAHLMPDEEKRVINTLTSLRLQNTQ